MRIAMMPWLYAPILAQPMSSPMIMMMLGCLPGVCASAGAASNNAAARPVNAREILRNRFMRSPFQSGFGIAWRGWSSTPGKPAMIQNICYDSCNSPAEFHAGRQLPGQMTCSSQPVRPVDHRESRPRDVLAFRQRQHLEQLAHLGGRRQLLHGGGFAQISHRRRIAACRAAGRGCRSPAGTPPAARSPPPADPRAPRPARSR